MYTKKSVQMSKHTANKQMVCKRIVNGWLRCFKCMVLTAEWLKNSIEQPAVNSLKIPQMLIQSHLKLLKIIVDLNAWNSVYTINLGLTELVFQLSLDVIEISVVIVTCYTVAMSTYYVEKTGITGFSYVIGVILVLLL